MVTSNVSETNGSIDISKRVVDPNGHAEIWLYQYRSDGQLIQWKHKDTPFVFRMFCAELEESIDPEGESHHQHMPLANKKGQKISFNDDRIKSQNLNGLFVDEVHQQIDSQIFDSYPDIKVIKLLSEGHFSPKFGERQIKF